MNNAINACEAVYVFPPTSSGVVEFRKILCAYSTAGLPAVVFKVAHFKGEKVSNYDYWFHGNGFVARLVLPLSSRSDETVDASIGDVATICTPLGAPEYGTIGAKGLKVPG